MIHLKKLNYINLFHIYNKPALIINNNNLLYKQLKNYATKKNSSKIKIEEQKEEKIIKKNNEKKDNKNDENKMISPSNLDDVNDEEYWRTYSNIVMTTPKRYRPLKIKKRGISLTHDPLYNKGTAFGFGERDRLGLRGLVPPVRTKMHLQVKRVLEQLEKEKDDMRRNLYLQDLQDRNETLFHRLLIDYIEDLAPLVYTPTVGKVCQEFGHRFRRSRGMYFCTRDRKHMSSMVWNWPHDDVRVIVVTDGSRILGLGDLGVNGMGIPIGKLALYCSAGGIAPHRVLPIMLDCGTDNMDLLSDPLYIGMPHPRLKGADYYNMVDEFMHAITSRWPTALIQFEDFSSDKAATLLEKYRDTYCCFNDDIQGTGSVALAGIMSALRIQDKPLRDLKKLRIVVAGAGSAGLGVAHSLLSAMMIQGMGKEEAQRNFWMCDENGLLGVARGERITHHQREFVRWDLPDGKPLVDVIRDVRPHVLLGLTACSGLFTEDVLKAMADVNERPIIFPLSNPTSNAECTAEDAYRVTEGRAIFASGSPFDPVTMNGRTFYPSQCNNMFIFPGLGLGVNIGGIKKVTDSMLYSAAEALANSLDQEDINRGQVFPSINKIRAVSKNVAMDIIHTAFDEGLTTRIGAAELDILESYIVKKVYDPVYVPLVDDVYN